MSAFEIPQAAFERAAADPGKCDAQAPDQWTVECELARGHDEPHRNNQTIWNDHITAGLDIATERWQGGRVLLFDDAEPDIGT